MGESRSKIDRPIEPKMMYFKTVLNNTSSKNEKPRTSVKPERI